MPKRRPLPPLRSLSSGSITHTRGTLEDLPCRRPDCTTVREEPATATMTQPTRLIPNDLSDIYETFQKNMRQEVERARVIPQSEPEASANSELLVWQEVTEPDPPQQTLKDVLDGICSTLGFDMLPGDDLSSARRQ